MLRIVFATVAALAIAAPAYAAEGGPELPKLKWSFNGAFGTFDRGEVQRGFQVYKEVCAACHSMHYVSYRNLADIGFTEAEVKAIAAANEVTAGPNDDGEMFQRPALPSDRFKSPYANSKAAAAANNGKAPPDLSLMAKARNGGADYIHALLTGYEKAPADVQVPEGGNYNKYFPGHIIAMPQPIASEGQVSYEDGTKPTVDQMSRDVSAFLMWAAEPKLEARHAMGLKVIIFLVIMSFLFYGVKRRVWADLH